MAETCTNAVVTISAASAFCCSRGFLEKRRETRSRLDEAVKLPYRCPDGTLGSVLMCPGAEYGVETQPIDERAWMLQERVLSSRVLSYTSHRLKWECLTTLLADGGLDPLHSLPCAILIRHCSIPSDDEMDQTTSPSGNTVGNNQEKRTDLVKSFSTRWHFCAEDKLPAIAGIDRRFQQSTGDTCSPVCGEAISGAAVVVSQSDAWKTTLNPTATLSVPILVMGLSRWRN